ncbi:MAG TPA: metalloregulator ArsR/SmtB family transcription factor [Anaerolineaceae bacterium]|nr:metalloregulator ArsR/SmtB family transcription factor [Anaerolineaceae bacterium]
MTALHWDFGSAYDFLISLFVIHHPDRFGLRPAWAAGVRSRLCSEDREFLDQAMSFLPVPIFWIHNLPLQEKKTNDVLEKLAEIPPEKRLVSLLHPSQVSEDIYKTIDRIYQNQIITPEDLVSLRSVFHFRSKIVKTKEVKKLAEAFLKPKDFGERLLYVLQSYYQVFFAEEEERILPALQNEIKTAQNLSESVSLTSLLEQLSHGVILEKTETLNKVTLIPSYWTSPLIFINNPQPDELVVVFGCRNETQNLIPGEYVPESLVNGLKALADPTRLRILHYLNHGATTPSSLAKKLRLRPPTVIHHLNLLRLAGFVQVIILSNGERRYKLRQEAVEETYKQLSLVINPGRK